MLRLDESSWDHEEIQAIQKCLNNDRTTMSVEVESFEKKFAEYVGSSYAVMVNSGSSANLLAAHAISLKYPIQGNKKIVIVPALSWSTTYFPWIQMGYHLRFVDINLNDLNIDVNSIENAIDENVVGICVPHILGAEADILRILELCSRNNLWCVEDTCESLGNRPKFSNKKMLGTFSKIGTYSFFRSHHISTMEGGMLVTDEEELAIYAKSLRAHGWARNIVSNNFLNNSDKEPWKSKFKFYLPGYNVRPLEISGAVGEIQLKKIDSFLKNRRENADLLKTMLKDFEFLTLQNQSESGSWMAFALLANSISRDKIVMLLEENNVETRPIVTGNFTNQPVIEKIRDSISISGDLKNSQIVEDCGFMVANHGRVLEKEILAIGKILENFC